MSADKRNHERSPTNAKVSISLPKTLLQEIDSLAAQERRTRSNMIVRLVEELLEKNDNIDCQDNDHCMPRRIAAEPKVHYTPKKKVKR